MMIGFECVECGRRHRAEEVEYTCPDCGGNLRVLYDYERLRRSITKSSLAADRDLSMWRYAALLPVGEGWRRPPLSPGWSPLFDCAPLAERYGVRRLLIKDEGRNPTASLKDRPSALAVVKAREAGARVITTASSGNAGSALAGMCAAAGLSAVIFVPEGAPPAKLAQMRVYGATVVAVEGSYDEAYDLCLAAGRRFGWYQRSTGYNPYMSEGKKTAALEAAEQLGWELPDKVFVAVGDGCIINGLWKGFSDLRRLGFVDSLPQMIAVQSDTAAIIVEALEGDGVVRESRVCTLADSICVGRPRDATAAVRAVRESGGCGVRVSDAEIVRAVTRLARATGVFAEPAAAASFAGFEKLCAEGGVAPHERVLLVLTASGLKDAEAARATLDEPLRVGPDIEELTRRLSTHAPSLL